MVCRNYYELTMLFVSLHQHLKFDVRESHWLHMGPKSPPQQLDGQDKERMVHLFEFCRTQSPPTSPRTFPQSTKDILRFQAAKMTNVHHSSPLCLTSSQILLPFSTFPKILLLTQWQPNDNQTTTKLSPPPDGRQNMASSSTVISSRSRILG